MSRSKQGTIKIIACYIARIISCGRCGKGGWVRKDGTARVDREEGLRPSPTSRGVRIDPRSMKQKNEQLSWHRHVVFRPCQSAEEAEGTLPARVC